MNGQKDCPKETAYIDTPEKYRWHRKYTCAEHIPE
jgi:hypothetical protein